MPKKANNLKITHDIAHTSIFNRFKKFLAKCGLNIFANTQEPFYQVLEQWTHRI